MSAELCREWLKKAEEDYEGAFVLSGRRKTLFHNLICFHAQQAAEKYLKAYLALCGIKFPKTHSLIALKNLCLQKDGEFELCSDIIQFLNPYSVEFRYPGEQANRRDAKRALNAAKEIRSFILAKIK